MSYNVGALPLIAKALGRKYGINVVISRSVQVPCTEGRTIWLPAMPTGNQQKATALLNGYIDHEAAHVRFSDFAQIQGCTSLERLFANVLEDPRVERRLTDVYPGCRHTLDALYEATQTETEHDIAASSDALAIITQGLLGKLLLDVNQRKGIGEKPWERVMALLGPVLAQQVLEIAIPVVLSDDPGAAIPGAKAILELLKEAGHNPDNPGEDPGDAEAENSSAGASGSGSGPGSGTNPEQGGDSPEQGESASGPQGSPNRGPSAASSGKGGAATPSPKGASGSGAINAGADADADAAESAGGQEGSPEGTHTGYEAVEALLNADEEHIRAVEEQLGAEQIAAKGLAEVSEFARSSLADDDVHVATWKASPTAVSLLGVDSVAKALRYRLEDTLQHRQEEGYHSRAAGTRMIRRRTGLYEAGVRKIFKYKEDHEALNTAIYVSCDISGSMQGGNLDQAKIATICIGDALRGFDGISYQVTTFDTRVFTYQEDWVKARQQLAATPAQGGTCFAPSLFHGMDWLAQVDQARKLLILVTDGEPSDPDDTQFLLRQAEQDGVELYALAIASSISSSLTRLYGRRVGLVRNIKELPALLGELVEHHL